MKKLIAVAALLLVATTTFAQDSTAGRGGRGRGGPPPDPRNRGGGTCVQNAYNCVDTPNPTPIPNTIWLEELTWIDVRDVIKAGKTTVIIATGGMEPNGPWISTGKHNWVLQSNCEAIARKLGNALCAPLVKFVPEGNIDPPTSHMVSPGTISMREDTFRAMLTDIAASLKMHGFKTIIYIGDSGGNQAGQRYVADSLTKIWKGDPIIAHVQEYYDYAGAARYMRDHGIVEDTSKADHLHDDPVIALNIFHTDPKQIRWAERKKIGKASINGISLADSANSAKLAKDIVAFRAQVAVDAINKAIANKGTLPAVQRGRGGSE